MSAASGISVSQQLADAFATADANHLRFLKVGIQNEQLVLTATQPRSRDLSGDLTQLSGMCDDAAPAFILARLDNRDSEWILISYVPDAAKVRDKMLYASSRAALSKALGDYRFVESIFATTKEDLTPEGYQAFKRMQAAPPPLSAREQEMVAIREAERVAGGGYTGSQARKSHVTSSVVGLAWGPGVEEAIKELAQAPQTKLVVLNIDPTTEKIALVSSKNINISQVAESLPRDSPSYAFIKWHYNYDGQAGIATVFIYTCPALSPIKHRMIYSSGASGVAAACNSLGLTISKKLESSDPEEITESYLKTEVYQRTRTVDTPPQGFARPKGPGRKR